MLEVVVAEDEAWARVRALRLASLAGAPDAYWRTSEEELPQPEAWWRTRLADPDRVTLVAVLDGIDVGLAGVGPHHEHDGDAGLYMVWVAPAARGAGVIDALLDAATTWARGRGHRRLRLDVGDTNAPAVGAYRRAGFTPTGVRSTFPAPRDHITEHELALELRAHQ